MRQKWILLFMLPAFFPAKGQPAPSAAEIILRVVAQDKVLRERRKDFTYDLTIRREKLDANRVTTSSSEEKVLVKGDNTPSYGTRGSPGRPDAEAAKASREEPFELLNIIDHYDYRLEGEENVDGVLCYKVRFTPKANMPYRNREEKVLNAVQGHMWAAKKDFSIIRNEGSLQHPVSVAWVFASLEEMEFHFDTRLLPNGDSGPAEEQYRYRVSIPFMSLHERDTRMMSGYRMVGAMADKAPAP